MSHSRTIKIGVIGAGYLGEFHIQQLQTLGYVDVVGFIDSNQKRSDEIQNKYNVKSYSHTVDLSKECDGVIVATPTSTHYQIAREVLNNESHVFIEKPITTTSKDAQSLIELAHSKNLFIQVGHIERFNPAFLDLKTKIITPQFIEIHRLASFKSRGQDTSVVLDLMIHDIDIILDIVHSTVKDIQANGVKVITNEVDIANARISFNNGCIVNLTSSRISLKEMRKMRIFQEKSYINIDFLNKSLEEYSLTENQEESDKHSQIFPYDSNNNQFIMYKKNDSKHNNALQEELKHFVDCIINSNTPAVNGNVALNALEVALVIQDQIDVKQ